MTPLHLLIPFMAVLLALINVPVAAQENAAPPALDPAKGAPPAAEAPAEKPSDKPRPERSRSTRPAPAEKLTPFIGVLTTHVSPELRAQLGLPEGFGLQVVEIMPESPAKEAGLKVHDILVKFGDQQLVNMEQLQTLVRARTKGDEVPLSVISGGKEATITVRIGEQMMPERPEEFRRAPGRFFNPNSGTPGVRTPPGAPMQNLQESVERFQNRLREYQERLQQWSRDGHRGTMPTPPVFEQFPPHGPDHRPGFQHEERRENSTHHSAGVTRRDESGTYSLRRADDRSIFSVRPKGGGEENWSFSNETQRSMIPEQYREKLRMLEEVAEEMRRGDADRDGHRKAPSRPGSVPERPRDPDRETEGKQGSSTRETL